jgi:C-terminal processing protease CtpA/Prc
LDWTNELVGIEEQSNSPVEPPINDDDVRRIMINIRPLPGQSFGFQIASSKDPSFVYIKNVNTEPALSAGLAVNDIIISVSFLFTLYTMFYFFKINGIPTIGASQNEVAQLLRTSCEQATIEIQRDLNQDTNEETVVVVKLDKRKAKTIGFWVTI